MQHLERYEDRKAKLDAAIAQVKEAVEALKKEGLQPELEQIPVDFTHSLHA